MRDLRVSFPKPCREDWAGMTPAGRARHCAGCDKAVHDLSKYDLAEAQALIRAEPELCVRARIGPDGAVALKPSRRGGSRRMAVAMAATAGLLTAGGSAMAKTKRPQGEIAGKVDMFGLPTRVAATDQTGRKFKTKTGAKGRYKIKHLPPGTYRLTFKPSCGEEWTVEDVEVGQGRTEVPVTGDESGCIMIGMVKIEESRG